MFKNYIKVLHILDSMSYIVIDVLYNVIGLDLVQFVGLRIGIQSIASYKRGSYMSFFIVD